MHPTLAESSVDAETKSLLIAKLVTYNQPRKNMWEQFGNMSLIVVNKHDVAVGKPLPWPLYDQQHNLIFEQGSVVRDNEHRDKLLANGAFRELSWGSSGDDDSDSNFLSDEEVSFKITPLKVNNSVCNKGLK